jgi:hypothetical protein
MTHHRRPAHLRHLGRDNTDLLIRGATLADGLLKVSECFDKKQWADSWEKEMVEENRFINRK